VLGAGSLDDEAALALLRACDGVPALLRLLRGGAPPPAGAARVLTPPAPADVMEPLLRDACLHGLTLVARLGGAALLDPSDPALCLACCEALLAPEPRTRCHAAAFWQCVCVWPEHAGALARTVVALSAARSAGVVVGGDAEGAGAQQLTSGLAVMRALAESAEPELALVAAGAVANVLQHASLAPLWTDAPRRQSYLLAVDEAERERLLRRPAELAKPTSE